MKTSTLIVRSAAVSASLLIAVLITTGPPSRAASLPIEPPGDSTRGRDVYARYCTQCHGMGGDGKGEVAPWTQPKPRDFRGGVYKFRSTPMGTLPTTADLDRTIREGLYGTLMPPFEALNRRARQDVIAYLETFSPRWRQEKSGTPVVVTAEPTPTPASITRGRDLFATTCASCHGDGTGNGLAATGMADAWGSPVPPADLTLGRTKSARTARDIYLRVATGLNGTPMPGFAGALRPDEIWAVTHYVQALGPWKGSTPALRAVAAQLAPASAVPNTDSAAAETPAATDAPTASDTPTASDATVGTDAKVATHVVRMVGEGTSYRFEPASLTARVGDIVRFVNVSGGPHNVAFWADSIPSGAAATLQKNMGETIGPLNGALVIAPNAAYVISLTGLPAGTYKYYCLPHLAMKMTGRIEVRL